MPIVVVGRPEYTDKLKNAIQERESNSGIENSLILIDYELKDISSTLIRQKLKDGEDITTICPKNVPEYLKNNNLIS